MIVLGRYPFFVIVMLSYDAGLQSVHRTTEFEGMTHWMSYRDEAERAAEAPVKVKKSRKKTV